MCEPTTLFAAAMGANSLFSMYQQSSMTEKQWAIEAENMEKSNAAAMETYLSDSSQLVNQQIQADERDAQERLAAKLDTQKRVGAARAAGAESGIRGISLDNQVMDLIRGGSNNLTTIDSNSAYEKQQREYEKKSLQRSAKGRVQDFKVARPSRGASLLGAGLQIGGSAMQGYATGKSISS